MQLSTWRTIRKLSHILGLVFFVGGAVLLFYLRGLLRDSSYNVYLGVFLVIGGLILIFISIAVSNKITKILEEQLKGNK